MMKSYVIGLDIGTSSAKAVLFNRTGYVVSEREIGYPTYHPHIGWSEQDPLEIEQATKQALKEVIEQSNVPQEEICAIGLSAAMHSLICVDESCEPLSPLITWADQRSTQQAEYLRSLPNASIYLNTGTPQHPMAPLAKLVWMKETGYTPYLQASKFISFKEFMLARWFNTYVVDYAVASATGLFNNTTFEWDNEALNAAGITTDQLSKPVPPTHVCQGLQKEIADYIGIRADIPFVLGSSDGPLANIGVGAMDHGDVAITIGTSGAIRQMTSSPRTDQLQEVFCYTVAENLWVMGGPTNNGGNVLQWMRNVLGEKTNTYDQLTELASTSSIGANGLLFLPYLNGERAPIWDAKAKGSYIGLTTSHTKADMIRAGLEGTIYSLYHINNTLTRLAGEPKTLLASGGFSRSRLWLQILADIFGKEIHLPLSHQSSAWGAAWFALMAVGVEEKLEDIKGSIPMKETIEPNEKAHKNYQTMFSIYEQASSQLRTTFGALSAYQSQ
ncbi:gluconokinase [bacterium LRH843]|nr:gluconokinase [bacterium LRH843]